MARGIHRLTAAEVKAQTASGHFADGGGLYLQVSKWGTKSWVYKFTLHGRTRGMGLGPIHTFSLAEARARCADLRKLVADGVDPIEKRKADNQKSASEAQSSLTFAEAMEKCLAKKTDEFRNQKHRKQWRSTLDTYAIPVLGAMNVADIQMQDVLRVLEPIWRTKTETASRLRGRIEAVLSWATVAGYRAGDNPARWAGNLKELLPKPSAVASQTHQPALALAQTAAWFGKLKERDGFAARALEFLTLCAARSGEVRGMTWDEINFDTAVWTVPAQRMKMQKEHRVPLSTSAIELLTSIPRLDGSDHVFPAAKGGPLSDMALSAVMRRMHEAEIKSNGTGWLDTTSGRPAVPHGMRSTFRDWAAENGVPRDMAEIALAHTVGSEVERAYRRSDMLERRRSMMDAWAHFCARTVPNNVIEMKEKFNGQD